MGVLDARLPKLVNIKLMMLFYLDQLVNQIKYPRKWHLQQQPR
jgi:hypothetical protein